MQATRRADGGDLQQWNVPLTALLRSVEEYGIVVLNGEGRVLSWSRGAERISGHSEQQALGALYEELFPRETSGEHPPAGEATPYDGCRIARGGTPIWVHEVACAAGDESGGATSLRIVHDIGARLAAIHSVRESERLYRELVEWSPEATMLHDLREVLYANRAAVRLVGASEPAELLGHSLLVFLHPRDRARMHRRIREVLVRRRSAGPLEFRVCTRAAVKRTVEVTLIPVEFRGQAAVQLIAHDISGHKAAAKRLQHRALHDPLTGLPNRVLFLHHLRHAVAACRRHSERRFAVLFVDMDGFKAINDRYGHAAGDRLLTLFAQRLQRSVRPNDTAARLAGDEFTVLLEDLTEVSEAVGAAERLQQACRQPFRIGDQEISLPVSVGIAMGDASRSPEWMLEAADQALYRAKGEGGDRCQVHGW